MQTPVARTRPTTKTQDKQAAAPAQQAGVAAARAAGAGRRSRRAFREIFESVSLASQFRIAAIAAVTVTLIAVQLVVALWDSHVARQDALELANDMATAIAARVARSGPANALDGLAGHRVFIAADLHLPTGEVLQRFDRGTPLDGTNVPGSPEQRPVAPAGSGIGHRVLQLLSLQPMYVERAVQVTPQVTGTIGLLLDHRLAWNAAADRLGQAPIVLILGFLVALLAANSLKRQVVEPLAQLADATRVRGLAGLAPGDAAAPAGRRRNELNELADNFNALADRLAAYERDMTTLRVTSRQEIIERTRELETGLRRAEALTRSKDEFLANMSHEIRTPMNGVLGMAELLAGTDLDKRQRRYVDSMRTAAETMMQIINDILDDSKIEAGKMDLIREKFDVREFAEQVGQLFAGRAESKKLELTVRVEPTVPAAVEGDVLRLRQVVGNLMSNAVKYTAEGRGPDTHRSRRHGRRQVPPAFQRVGHRSGHSRIGAGHGLRGLHAARQRAARRRHRARAVHRHPPRAAHGRREDRPAGASPDRAARSRSRCRSRSGKPRRRRIGPPTTSRACACSSSTTARRATCTSRRRCRTGPRT